jgi:hypothetical protein
MQEIWEASLAMLVLVPVAHLFVTPNLAPAATAKQVKIRNLDMIILTTLALVSPTPFSAVA